MAGTARFINQRVEVDETTPISMFSVIAPNFAKYKSIKYNETEPRTPSSAMVTVGIAVIIKNIRLMIMRPCNNGISIENIMSKI